jgi:hypothetical protein
MLPVLLLLAAVQAPAREPGRGGPSPTGGYCFRVTLESEGVRGRASVCAFPELDSLGGVLDGTVRVVLDVEGTGPITAVALTSRSSALDVPVTPAAAAAAVGRPGYSGTVQVVRQDASKVSALADLLRAPAAWQLALQAGGKEVRAPLVSALEHAALVTAGRGQSSTITLVNRSDSEPASGVLQLSASDGGAMSGALPAGASTPFSIPPSGTATLRTSDRGDPVSGYARIWANVRVTAEVAPGGEAKAQAAPTHAGKLVALPVTIDRARGQDVRIAVLTMEDSGTHLVLSATDERGMPVPDGTRHLPLGKGQHLTGLLSELIPALGSAPFRGTVAIERQWATFPGGKMALAAFTLVNGRLVPLAPKSVQ